MTRTRASAKAAGSKMEASIVAYLNRCLGPGTVERRVQGGVHDRGDVAGLRTRDGARVVVESKDVARHDLSGWTNETQKERVADDALVGVTWFKRRGAGSAADCFVLMTGDDFVALLTGARPDPYVPGGAA